MAEALGLVASIVQVAGACLQLSKTLYLYADNVATADRRIKNIAKEIQLTSSVMQELGNVFGNDEMGRIMSATAVQTARDTVVECSAVFAEIDTALNKSKRNMLSRLLLPFRDTKIELLRSHIDKLKSTLMLLMQVFTHAYHVASNKVDREAEARQRKNIEQLLEKRDQSARNYEAYLRGHSMNTDTVMNADEESTMDEATRGDIAVAAAAIGSTINAASLDSCVQHVRILLEDIEILQESLNSSVLGDDHSEHHQNVLGSYLRARNTLDQALCGSINGYKNVAERETDLGKISDNPHMGSPQQLSITTPETPTIFRHQAFQQYFEAPLPTRRYPDGPAASSTPTTSNLVSSLSSRASSPSAEVMYAKSALGTYKWLLFSFA